MYGQRFRRATSNIGLDDLGLDDFDYIPSSTSTADKTGDILADPMMLAAIAGIAPVGGLGIGAMANNKSQEETKVQQLAQMKYM